MAWRIDEQVVRGEIDNCERGRVAGRIWLVDRPDPVELKLEGNCWRDLAGLRLEFVNPAAKSVGPEGLDAAQTGVVGDITASRKVKVPEIPLEEIGEYYLAKKPFPWRWGNSLYLEWYSRSNGRVVIESASYELKIVGEPAWEMSPEEEEDQRRANGAAMEGFMDQLTAAASDQAEWEETDGDDAPLTEQEAERIQARSDKLVDRIQVRMAREGPWADFEKIMQEELRRLREELGEPESPPGSFDPIEVWDDEPFDSASGLGGKSRTHPLAERAQELSLRLARAEREAGWIPEGATEEHPAADLVAAVMKAGAKLAGALNGIAWPPGLDACAGVIVRLKRARGYFDDALRALESCQEHGLLNAAELGTTLVDIVDLAQDTDTILAELRERLG